MCSQLVAWTKQFLTARQMHVRVRGSTSDRSHVASGVPQGSVLGPILFLIYVNHVVNGLTCMYKIFADDIKLYISSSPRDAVTGVEELQLNIDMLVETSKSWGLRMNVDKCVCLRFGPRSVGSCSSGLSPYRVNGVPIKFSTSHSDLGVKVDRNLKFHDHTRSTANTCNALSTNLFTSTICREQNFLLTAYKTLIRPKLEYACTMWSLGYLGDLRSLERVQKRWTREIRGLEDLPYSERLRRLNLFSVQGRLLRSDMVLTWKIFAGECAIHPSQLFELSASARRGHPRKIFLPRSNLEIRRRFFAIRVIHTWNALSEETACAATLRIFKRLLHRDLGQELFNYVD